MEKRTVILMLAACCAVLSSCGGSYEMPEDFEQLSPEPEALANDSPSVEENLFGDGDGEVLGFIQHNAKMPQADEQDGQLSYSYDGAELHMDYSFQVEGKGESIGFLMFVNGEAQPYRVDDSQSTEYCHIFPVDGKAQKDFTFHFVPVSGKKGERVSLEIVSIFHPAFLPDMVDTTSYGWYHRIVSNCFSIQMKQDAPERKDVQKEPVIKDIKRETKKVTKEYLETNLAAMGWSGLTTESLNSQTYYELAYDGKITYDNLRLEQGKNLHITYSLCGSPGVEYVSTLFINHTPVATGDEGMMRAALSKGDLTAWEIDLDAEHLPERATFYIVSVPRNRADFPNVNAMVIKTDSICLYKEG